MTVNLDIIQAVQNDEDLEKEIDFDIVLTHSELKLLLQCIRRTFKRLERLINEGAFKSEDQLIAAQKKFYRLHKLNRELLIQRRIQKDENKDPSRD